MAAADRSRAAGDARAGAESTRSYLNSERPPGLPVTRSPLLPGRDGKPQVPGSGFTARGLAVI